jgi:hypothetical protein
MANWQAGQTAIASICQTSFVLATMFSVVPGVPAQGAADVVARGRYLADAGDCVACHTKKDGQLMPVGCI